MYAGNAARLLDSPLFSPYASFVARAEDEPELQQPTFGELEAVEPEPTVIEHCIVTSEPIYVKNKKGAVWECAVHTPPDLFHQEQDDTYQLRATAFANEAKRSG